MNRGGTSGLLKVFHLKGFIPLLFSTASAYLHIRMSSPPTLQKLARKSLLKNEALATASLKKLPKAFFPPLFKDAFTGRQTDIIRAMVAAWPYPCLPVGALMKIPNLKTLKAVLGGLDLLINQKDRPSTCKLQELDLRDAQHDFWNFWVGTEDGVCSPDVISETPPMVHGPRRREKQVVTVWMDFSLMTTYLCKYLKYFYWWAKQRKDVVQVMCPKLEFWDTPIFNPLMLLEVFEPSSIGEFAVNGRWTLSDLVKIAPGLGQMKNLQKIFLNGIFIPFEWLRKEKKVNKRITEIIYQISELKKIQHLQLNNVCFLNERLDQVLRCLESPLETLSITRCLLSNADMSYLSQCPSIHKLKHLDLSGVTFLNLDHLLLARLLERLTATLQTLRLKGCMILDYQISSLLPALSQCTQLIEVNFMKNFLSVASLKQLLQHTAKLTLLTREMYPAPDEVYDDIGDVHPDRFSQHCSELMETLRGIRQPKEVCFVSKRCVDLKASVMKAFENIIGSNQTDKFSRVEMSKVPPSSVSVWPAP
ncbi:PRAME family member 12-like [Arvicola amphibius]|uniref:PRAME family member 12-like n=1 Tax=Arvicola amphibius TaxID=1047088 RepID=UPI001C0A0805|nr:PRAME family member 12-like [Arvicola amphibius]